jgi:ppGpp synthetase/RelA/SpoT-type nucleotidyltranferase
MIAPSALQQIYNEINALMVEFKGRVEPLLRGAARAAGGRFVEGRVKPIESLLLKLHKDARRPALAEMDDIFATTIVVPDTTRIPLLKDELRLNFVIERQSEVKTNKPEEFIYDDLHLFLRLNTPLLEEKFSRILFELQVKTEMQSASAMVTRALTYKTKSLSWVKTRLASRIRALVEMLDELLARIAEEPDEEDDRSASYRLFAERNRIIAVCRESFSESELPEDMRRLSVIVHEQLRQCQPKTNIDDLKALLHGEAFQKVRKAQSISIVDKIFIALYKANRITADFREGRLHGDKAYLITAEMVALCPELAAIPQDRQISLLR